MNHFVHIDLVALRFKSDFGSAIYILERFALNAHALSNQNSLYLLWTECKPEALNHSLTHSFSHSLAHTHKNCLLIVLCPFKFRALTSDTDVKLRRSPSSRLQKVILSMAVCSAPKSTVHTVLEKTFVAILIKHQLLYFSYFSVVHFQHEIC